MLFCLLRLHCVFIESEYLDVSSGKNLSVANQPAIILIFENIAFFVIACCVCFGRGFD